MPINLTPTTTNPIVIEPELQAIAASQARWPVVDQLDFTAAEPAHVADSVWLNTTTGTGSTTTGTTFTAGRLYQSDGSAWAELIPTEGWKAFDQANDQELFYNGTVWHDVKYSQVFDGTTSWGTAAGGDYTLTILQTLHLMGTTPVVTVFSGSSAPFTQVFPDINVLANGDVELVVSEVPDGRFAGRVVIQ